MKKQIICTKCKSSNLSIYSGPKKVIDRKEKIIKIVIGYQCEDCDHRFVFEVIHG